MLYTKTDRENRKLPLKGVFALSPEEIHMGLELQLEDIILLNAVCLYRGADCVAKQRETGQGIIVLEQPNSPALSARHPLPHSSSQRALTLLYRTGKVFVFLFRREREEEQPPLSFGRLPIAYNETFPQLLSLFLWSYLLLFPCPSLPPGLPPFPSAPSLGNSKHKSRTKIKISLPKETCPQGKKPE